MMIIHPTLRPYQKEAIDKILWAKEKNLPGNDLVVLPTGAGKSIVIAEIVHKLNEPVLILQPTKEILEQNYDKLIRYVPESEVGIYSASMNEKTIKRYTFATIGSIYKKSELFKRFKLIIIDEAHLVNPSNLSGMFTTFLKQIGSIKCIGLTATPYRMATGHKKMGLNWEGKEEYEAYCTIKLINRLRGKAPKIFWDRVLYNINVSDLVEQGYLCALEYIDVSVVQHEDIPLNKAQTDFDMVGFEKLIVNEHNKISKAIEYAETNCKSVLVFCSSVSQAESLAQKTKGSAVVSAKTPKKERAQIIQDFKTGRIKTVFNMGVLTTGFDHPSLDGIVLIRPTRSIALYYQMLGRGVRIAQGKTSCKVIDLTSTVKNMGRVETIKMVKREMWELESETGSWHNSDVYRVALIKDHDGSFHKANTSANVSGALRSAFNSVHKKE